eukprot:760016-Hanusia_phi.AAC.1
MIISHSHDTSRADSSRRALLRGPDRDRTARCQRPRGMIGSEPLATVRRRRARGGAARRPGAGHCRVHCRGRSAGCQ